MPTLTFTRLYLCVLSVLSASAGARIGYSQGFGGEGYDQIRAGIDPGYPAVTASGDSLKLEPNTVYAESPGTMNLVYDKERKSEEILTHDGFRSEIRNLLPDGSAATWGVLFKKSGDLTVKPEMKIAKKQAGKSLLIELVRVSPTNERAIVQSQSFKSIDTDGRMSTPPGISFSVLKEGFYEVKLRAPASQAGNGEKLSSIGDIGGLSLSGDAVEGSQVMCIRSPRAGAVHATFESSKKLSDVILVVIEVRIATPDQPGQYFPVTTPFGYFGSTWKNDMQRFGGANFSLWSETEAAHTADISKLSRLLGYRSDATYTVYGHEGIGVKPVGSNPWESMKPTTREILAVRKVPGKELDGFACYFANLDTGEWELYGAGQKFNKTGKLQDLDVGAFMEVLYPSPHMRRESHYRGWFMTQDKTWHQIDQIRHGNYKAAKDMSHRTWGVTEDGFFWLSTGGWYPNDHVPDTLKLPPKHLVNPADRPAYLKGKLEQSLLELPIGIDSIQVGNIQSKGATVTFEVRPKDFHGSARIYFGEQDKATFPHDLDDRGYPFVANWKWKDFIEVKNVGGGKNTVVLKPLQPGKQYYFRIFAEDKKYSIWSPETRTFQSKK